VSVPAAQQPGAAPAPAARTPAASVPAQVAPATVAEAAGRGYVLQFGFFSSVARAEELKARLAQAGIPAQVETRLVVGPFADRKEALAAQSRLREKGIDTGVLLPLGR
ncbi:SPOR domain-containing protein, partial [Zoogloea sp.]|uniref:SPOR domain-containing protein n=1 Tax=Zoogloea sp. TaxID=49181 RepID=UPI00141582D8